MPEDRTGETVRDLWKASLQCARSLQSPQTGFIHYTYNAHEGEAQHCIPLYENVLFCLCLFRSGLIENISEGKIVLDRLLHFQNNRDDDSKGNFPVYIHNYPECSDRFLGIILLLPFYRILQLYGRVLGGELKARTETAVRNILLYTDNLERKKEIPFAIAVRAAAALISFGTLWGDPLLVEKGNEKLSGLRRKDLEFCMYSTQSLADVLAALQTIYPSLKNSPWNAFWEYLNSTRHRGTAAYVGLCNAEEQKGEEPKVGLYDYLLGTYSGSYSRRAKLQAPVLLQAALLHPVDDTFDDRLPIGCTEGTIDDYRFRLIYNKDWACTITEKPMPDNPREAKTHTPFRLVWGDSARVHTLVCRNIDLNKMLYTCDSSVFTLFFRLESPAPSDDKEKHREVNFYLDYDPCHQIRIAGSAASTFELGQPITIRSGDRNLSLKFELAEGSGQFQGHLMRGNRPSQTENKGSNRFASYDWHVFLRTVRRHDSCVIKATITVLS